MTNLVAEKAWKQLVIFQSRKKVQLECKRKLLGNRKQNNSDLEESYGRENNLEKLHEGGEHLPNESNFEKQCWNRDHDEQDRGVWKL